MGTILRFLGAFASSAFLQTILRRILVALGITAVTYTGIGAIWSQIQTAIAAQFSSLGSLLQVLQLGGFGEAVSIIVSAYTAKVALAGLTSAGALTRVTWKGGGSVFGS